MTTRKMTALFLAVLMFATAFVAAVPMDIYAGASTTFEALEFDYDRNNVYANFIVKHSDAAKPEGEIEISASSFVSGTEGVIARESIDGRDDVVEFLENVQEVEYEVTVPEAGLYNIYYFVRGHESIKNDMEFAVSVNGEYQYNEVMTIRAFRGFKNSEEGFGVTTDGNEVKAVFADDRGNDLRPRQTKDLKWRGEWLVDSAGLIDDPMYLYFEEGVNTIGIKTVGEPFYISGIKLTQFKQPKSYAEVSAEYAKKGYKPVSSQIKIQAETANEFSSSALYPISERNNPQMEPSHVSKTRINASGGPNWGTARSWIKWEFEAPESGLYQLAIKFEQSDYVGMFATRTLKIDGEYPFAEMKYLSFEYDSSWQILQPHDKTTGEPYYIYLEKGNHELQLTVSLGEMASIVDRLTTAVYRLNGVYSDIVMLASTAPDPYYDYEYEKNIPDLLDNLKWARTELADIKDEIIEITGTGSSQTATLETFIIQLDNLIEDTDEFNKRLEAFKNNIASISQWIIDNKKQPIKIDYFVLGGDKIKLDKPEAGFFKGFWAGTQSFFASFVEDYDIVGSVGGEGRKVKVWVNTGRDQINIINNMINDEFTPKSGINVQLELVQGNMIEATLAKKGPDVALMIAADQPVNYAIRNAIVDLSEFEGETIEWTDGEGNNHTYEVRSFEDVFGRYQPQNFEAFAFQRNEHKDEEAEHLGEKWICDVCGTENQNVEKTEDGKIDPKNGICTNCKYKNYYAYYAIPETQTFNMMFYRKDILAELGLGVPDTWEEFFALLPVLRRNNLEVGVPAATMYQILLYQYGGSYYTADKKASGLTTPEAQKAFVTVTDCFTKYDFPLTFNFYTRFRSGEMPISIQPYTQFNQINAAAPEIQGLWDMTMVPGTVKNDGTEEQYTDRSQNVTSAGCIMFQNTKDKDAAWAFMEWYNRNEMQTRYGEELESVMGAAGRYAAANQDAFSNLAWTREQRSLLGEQMKSLVGVPEVPGSYFTGRTVTLAFNDAYIEMENPYKALSERAEDLDDEISRKYAEFGLK